MYKAIADYGAIGNMRTVALVGKDGAIDWCCFPYLSSPSVFGALLDARKGGCFQVTSATGSASEQAYIPDTNVLQTYFDTESGHLTVTDFMPLSGDLERDAETKAPPEIHRILKAEGGDIAVKIIWSPRFDYARVEPTFHQVQGGVLAESGDERLVLGGLPADAKIDLAANTIYFTLSAGRQIALVSRWDSIDAAVSLDESLRALDETTEAWREWVRKENVMDTKEWAAEWRDLVIRSELVLKLLIFAKTGAMAAAATTSLPETIGGVRNWDYRYTWIRDAALTAQALTALGHTHEANDFINWIEDVAGQPAHGDFKLQIMYGLHGETDLEEFELDHLEGYMQSAPVRIGNGAAPQKQLDIYGDLLDAAYDLTRRGQPLSPQTATFLTKVADEACSMWQSTDHGIWEMRAETRHFVYSKGMIWVAMDRAIALHSRGHIQGDVKRWTNTRDKAHRMITDQGFNPDVNAFVQYFGSKELDASNLLLPIYEVLPVEDPRVQGTIDGTLEHLTTNGLVYRYRSDDGLPGEEGAFGLCTFWLVDVLALSGRMEEAYTVFESMTKHANHLGLFAEQVDPHKGLLLGNFPQAFTHIGLINSALYLAYAEGKPLPAPTLIGTQEHREELQGLRTTKG